MSTLYFICIINLYLQSDFIHPIPPLEIPSHFTPSCPPWRGRVLVYDVVKTNIGNGYRSHTGVFLVPKSGVYVFTWTFRTGNNYDHSIQLMKNKEDVGSVYFHSGHGRAEAGGTGIVVTHANAGDDVFTRTNPTLYIETGHYIQSNAHGRSSFAGWKIF